MSQQGWIKVHRSIQEHWLWKEKPFSKAQAWIDILLQVNHQDGKMLIGNTIIEIKRGQKLWSILEMSRRWGWSRKKVSDFLNTLQTDGMLNQKRTSKYTILTIENYDLYQDTDTTKEHQKDIKRTSKEHQKNTNKNDKNVKNEKKDIYMDYVLLTSAEYEKLIKEYGESVTKDYIERLNDYIAQIGVKKANAKYKSHYAVIRNWYRRDNPTGKKEEGTWGWDK